MRQGKKNKSPDSFLLSFPMCCVCNHDMNIMLSKTRSDNLGRVLLLLLPPFCNCLRCDLNKNESSGFCLLVIGVDYDKRQTHGQLSTFGSLVVVLIFIGPLQPSFYPWLLTIDRYLVSLHYKTSPLPPLTFFFFFSQQRGPYLINDCSLTFLPSSFQPPPSNLILPWSPPLAVSFFQSLRFRQTVVPPQRS